jgi:hypothetical protein
MHKLLGATAAALAAVVAAALPSVASATPVTTNSRITQNGLGAIRLGMTVDQAQRRSGQRIQNNLFTPGDDSCGIGQLFPQSLGVGFQTTHSRIWVINVSRPGIRTRAGIQVGDRVAALRRAYGSRLRSQPNKYIPGARDYWVSFGAKRKIKFYVGERNHSVIAQISSGRKPEVDFVEGCS